MGTVNAKLVKWNSKQLTMKFTTRIDSAVEMLALTEKLRVEQETDGPWQEFLERLRLGKVHAYVSTEFFTGISDVIFEATVLINSEDEILELGSEQIAGTIFKEVIDYMEWHYVSLVKDYYSDKLKELSVFRGY